MLRGLVVLASTSAVGGDPSGSIYAAQAIELLHGASLFHDDVMDGAEQRRGLPALHRRTSISDAILLGDFALLRAFSLLCEGRERAPSAHVLDAIQVLGAQGQACCRGQRLEAEVSGQSVTEDTYFAIVQDKAAALFVAAAMIGAILGGGTTRDREALACYARHLGVAFQIGDDMLDLVGERDRIGKPVGNSLSNGRPLLPVIYFLKHGSRVGRLRWEELRRQEAPCRELYEIMSQEGIGERIRAIQASHVASSLRALEGMADSEGLRTLHDLLAAAFIWCS